MPFSVARTHPPYPSHPGARVAGALTPAEAPRLPPFTWATSAGPVPARRSSFLSDTNPVCARRGTADACRSPCPFVQAVGRSAHLYSGPLGRGSPLRRAARARLASTAGRSAEARLYGGSLGRGSPLWRAPRPRLASTAGPPAEARLCGGPPAEGRPYGGPPGLGWSQAVIKCNTQVLSEAAAGGVGGGAAGGTSILPNASHYYGLLRNREPNICSCGPESSRVSDV